MIVTEDVLVLLNDYNMIRSELVDKFNLCKQSLDVDNMLSRRNLISTLQSDPNFYSNMKEVETLSVEYNQINNVLESISQISSKFSDLDSYVELLSQDADELLAEEMRTLLQTLQTDIETLYLETLLNQKYDMCNAIVTIHSGAGGTEAQDWANMLYRMYQMYAAKQNFTFEELDKLPGDVAGIKSVMFKITGVHAYGYLKAEKGVHRLVRISPFNANGKRQTSFASVEIMPEIENDTSIEIRPEELKIDTYRSGGAGGQHVNKTDSAVRITHIPTGIVVQCQNERSQIQNREQAMKYLVSKLVERKEQERLEHEAQIRGKTKCIEWGSQIRSYVFQPYTLVKDHRTNFEITDINKVMSGEIQRFIVEYLKHLCIQ